MASISNIAVNLGDTTLLFEGTGSYDAGRRVIVCIGKWDIEPSVDSSYAINFESVDPLGQPFTACVCTDFEKGGEPTGAFIIQD